MTADVLSTLPEGLLIGKDWIPKTDAGTMEHINPTTGKFQRAFVVAGQEEVDAAVDAARAALPVWRSFTPSERRDTLHRLAALLRENRETFGAVTILETGLLSTVSPWLSLVASDWFDYYAGWVDKLEGDVINIPGSFNYTLPEPFGVIGVMITWNGPSGAVGMTCAAPLAAGCTIVLKSPELSPFSSNLFGQLCLDTGFPPGVVNVLSGGPAVGEALVRHHGIDKIEFTGSPATARHIQAAAAETLKPLVLELGGKSANIVFPDADLDRAVATAVAGTCMLNGQTCIAPTRLLVHESIYDDLVARVAKGMEEMPVGDPSDPATGMGPVINETAANRIIAMIEGTRDRGDGHLLTGGERLGGDLSDGYFVSPTLFTEIDNRSEIAQSEIFGPVLAAIKFTDEDHAIELANDTSYGLSAYLHTNDLNRAHRVAAALDSGNVAVNGGEPMAGPYAPFGGIKQSGYGKQGGYAGLLEFVRTKNVNINIS